MKEVSITMVMALNLNIDTRLKTSVIRNHDIMMVFRVRDVVCDSKPLSKELSSLRDLEIGF